MTHQQSVEFNLYGSGALCLIELAKQKGLFISESEFCDRFHRFLNLSEGHYGLLTTASMFEIARNLHICSHGDTFAELESVRALFLAGKYNGLILRTSFLSPRNLVANRCKLILGYNWLVSRWTIWDPQVVVEGMEISINEQSLSKDGHFVLFMD